MKVIRGVWHVGYGHKQIWGGWEMQIRLESC